MLSNVAYLNGWMVLEIALVSVCCVLFWISARRFTVTEDKHSEYRWAMRGLLIMPLVLAGLAFYDEYLVADAEHFLDKTEARLKARLDRCEDEKAEAADLRDYYKDMIDSNPSSSQDDPGACENIGVSEVEEPVPSPPPTNREVCIYLKSQHELGQLIVTSRDWNGGIVFADLGLGVKPLTKSDHICRTFPITSGGLVHINASMGVGKDNFLAFSDGQFCDLNPAFDHATIDGHVIDNKTGAYLVAMPWHLTEISEECDFYGPCFNPSQDEGCDIGIERIP